MLSPPPRLTRALRSAGCCAAVLLTCFASGWPAKVTAAHPLQTEDTGTQGLANLEFENGLSSSLSDGNRLWTYQPQLSLGVTPVLDLIVQPIWLVSRSGDGSAIRGLGDTNLDLKWRFFGSDPASLALRAGVTAATGEHGLGLRHGTVGGHALVVATLDMAPFTLHGNVGFTRNPRSSGQRTGVGAVSAALMWAPNERLTWTLDGGIAMNTDPVRHDWVTTVLAGAIYTVRPGLDIDAGIRSSVRASVSLRECLLGITYRFGL